MGPPRSGPSRGSGRSPEEGKLRRLLPQKARTARPRGSGAGHRSPQATEPGFGAELEEENECSGPVILKFGGTSVGDAEAIGRLVRHVSAARERGRAVVVVSALSGITDRLLQLAAAPRLTQRAVDRPASRNCRSATRRSCAQVVPESDCADRSDRRPARRAAKPAARRRDVEGRLAANAGRDRRASASCLSSRIVEGACLAAGLPAAWVDPASPRHERHLRLRLAADGGDRRRAAAQHLAPLLEPDGPGRRRLHRRHRDGVTTTLGRGGSDYSAAIVGAALDADARSRSGPTSTA